MNKNQKPYRSFFWPIILLGTGIIWLLVNLNIIPSESLWMLLQLWPVLIIVAGLDVLFARRWPLLGALLGLLVIGGVVYVLLNGAALGLEGKPKPQMESFVVAVGETQQVSLDLDLSIQDTFVTVLQDSENLMEAEIGSYGEVEFAVTGDQEKNIRLAQFGAIAGLPFLLSDRDSEELNWGIRLSSEVPFSLMVDASTGASELDLAELQLENLAFDGGTGSSKITLPPSPEGYDVFLEGSTGGLRVNLPDEGRLTLRLDGSTGEIVLVISRDAPLQIEVIEGGTGNLVLPDWISKVEGREGRDEGLYQTESFESAENQLLVIVEDIGTGNIIVE